MVEMDPSQIGRQIQSLREKAGLGLRELSRMAGMSPAALSAIEKGKSSPTLATLHKMLRALGTDFSNFFTHEPKKAASPVFSAAEMQVVEDAFRKYRFLLPKREDIRFEMLMETIAHTEKEPEWESHDCDFGGVVLSGGPMRLEVEGQGEWAVGEGDAFYVNSGLRHRALNLGTGPLKIVTVFDPARY
jgi:transcriptional regulator with XRE-family HTH domain